MANRCLVLRHGALGDVLMMTSILPYLQDEGWNVTVAAEPAGCEILKHDPRVSALLPVPPDAIPAGQHVAWGKLVGAAFDRVIDLTESVEVTLIKVTGRIDYYWPDGLRRRLCAVNFVEQIHAVADVPFQGTRQKFFPVVEEVEAADAWLADFRGPSRGPVIVWALAGSFHHKVWPGLPAAVARLLVERPDLRIVCTGSETEQPLAEEVQEMVEAIAPHDKNRVAYALTLPIRRAMTLACRADLVVGPETGLMHAVATEAMPKVMILSHSTPRNLTRDWVNTRAIAADPDKAPCWPCHRRHDTKEHCPQVGQHAACQQAITVPAVVDAILAGLAEAGFA